MPQADNNERGFFSFQDGVQISDARINEWIEECINDYLSGKTHCAISSGDTCVILLSWSTIVEIVVANSSGYSRIHFHKPVNYDSSCLESIDFGHEPYKRPAAHM